MSNVRITISDDWFEISNKGFLTFGYCKTSYTCNVKAKKFKSTTNEKAASQSSGLCFLLSWLNVLCTFPVQNGDSSTTDFYPASDSASEDFDSIYSED